MPKKKPQPNIRDLLGINRAEDQEDWIDDEQSWLDDEWWYIPTLIQAVKDQGSKPYDLHLSSLDLGRFPWQCDSILHFAQHCGDMEECDFKYPVIMAPAGWVLNGWHRIVKAILQGKQTIKVVRLQRMPTPDGLRTDEPEAAADDDSGRSE